MTAEFLHSCEFGPFHVDVAERRLARGSKPISLTPKVFETLLVLLEKSGRTVDELNSMSHTVSYIVRGGNHPDVAVTIEFIGSEAADT